MRLSPGAVLCLQELGQRCEPQEGGQGQPQVHSHVPPKAARHQLTCPSGSLQPWEAACHLPFGYTVMVLGLDVMQDLHFCTRAVGPGWEEQN